MRTVPVAILDANVLYPAQLRDVLMRLAVNDLLRAHWSEAICDEWMRNLVASRADITWDDVKRTQDLMDTALPGACVEGYEKHMADVSLPDPDDHHVLAAAIEADADYIVTNNLRDFPSRSLAPYEVTACSPDAFIMMLYKQAPEAVVGVVRALRASLSHPPQTPRQLLAHFRRSGLTRIADVLQRHNI